MKQSKNEINNSPAIDFKELFWVKNISDQEELKRHILSSYKPDIKQRIVTVIKEKFNSLVK